MFGSMCCACTSSQSASMNNALRIICFMKQGPARGGPKPGRNRCLLIVCRFLRITKVGGLNENAALCNSPVCVSPRVGVATKHIGTGVWNDPGNHCPGREWQSRTWCYGNFAGRERRSEGNGAFAELRCLTGNRH